MQGLNCNLVIRKDGYSSATVPLATSGNGEQKEIIVDLTKITETYAGKIVDYATRIPLQGVKVKLINRNTNNPMEVVTDVNGDYYVAMSPYTTYDYTITNPGYQDIVFALPIEDGQNRSVLGVIGMQPGVSGGGTVSPNPVTPVTPGGGTTTGGGTTNVQPGYAVQLAATNKLDLNRFNNLSNVGQVYAVEDGGRYKVRLGVFSTRAEAEQALRTAKSSGYSDAWIVQEAGSTTAGGGTPTTPNTGGQVTNPPSVTGTYMVQLAAYSKPQYFDRTKAETLGTITSRPKGNLTVMLVSNIRTLGAARDVRQRARAAGWDGAFIVQDQNGQLMKVE